MKRAAERILDSRKPQKVLDKDSMSQTKQQLKEKYNQEIKKLVDILKKYKPEKIILFGSVIQGKIHPDSDVDLCLIKNFKGPRIDQKQKIFSLLWKNNYHYQIEPDFHIYTPKIFNKELEEGHPFIEEIYNTGQVIYEKKSR